MGGRIDPYDPSVRDYLAARGLSLSDPLAPLVLLLCRPQTGQGIAGMH